jgi:S1-C subfamily serine protease
MSTETPPIGDASRPPRPQRHERWREWIIPRSVLGITSVLLSFSIGASLSGAVLYSYYEYRLTNTEKRVDDYIGGFDERFKTASDTIDAEKKNAQAAVQKELEPLRQFQSEGGTSAALVEKLNKSVWFVQTQDKNGQPSVGSAFVVESNSTESTLVGSLATVEASTRTPAPEIQLVKGNEKLKATLKNWVEDKDLAVFTIPKGNLPKLDWVGDDQKPRVGERNFVASGFGAAGASVTQGFVIDVSQNAFEHSAGVGSEFRGGPIVNSDGKVSGVASLSYAPFGFLPSGSLSYGVPIRTTCEKLLKCPAGNNSASEAQQR